MKQATFLIIVAIFVLTMGNIILFKTFTATLTEKIDVVHHNLYLAQSEFDSYKSLTNEMLEVTSSRITAVLDDISGLEDSLKKELTETVFLSANATSSRIDSLAADLSSLKHKATTLKSILK